MFTAITTIEPNVHGTVFFRTEKNANGGSTYSLPKSSSLSDQKSDIIELSPAARRKQENEEKARIIKSDSHTETSTNNLKLSQEEQKEVEEMRRINGEVKRRELAHRAVAGNYARGVISYEYETGPDGKKYAVEGHITIDARPILNNPEASIRKAQAIKSVKLDRSVSTEAEKMEREVRMELKIEKRKESYDVIKSEDTEETTDATPSQDLILNYKNPFNLAMSMLNIQA